MNPVMKCPVCGQMPEIKKYSDWRNWVYMYRCDHIQDGGPTISSDWFKDAMGAIDAWNTAVVAYQLAHLPPTTPAQQERGDALNLLAEALGDGATGDLVQDVRIMIQMYEHEVYNANEYRGKWQGAVIAHNETLRKYNDKLRAELSRAKVHGDLH